MKAKVQAWTMMTTKQGAKGDPGLGEHSSGLFHGARLRLLGYALAIEMRKTRSETGNSACLY